MLLLIRIIALALVSVSINSHVGTAQQQNGGRGSCPMTFHDIFTSYRLCQRGSFASWRSNLRNGETLTGENIVDIFNNFCPNLVASKACVMQTATSCQVDSMDEIEQAMDRTIWICDEEGQMRSSVATLLTSSSVLEQESQVSYCTSDAENVQQCANEAKIRLNMPQRLLNGITEMRIGDVFANPLSTQYFYALFDCALSRVTENCPSNALPMAMYKAYHIFFPPKFGINVSDILLTAGQDSAWI